MLNWAFSAQIFCKVVGSLKHSMEVQERDGVGILKESASVTPFNCIKILPTEFNVCKA